MAEGLSHALVPAAFGLILALMAMCLHKYLIAQVEALDFEMETASLQLSHDLMRLVSAGRHSSPWLKSAASRFLWS